MRPWAVAAAVGVIAGCGFVSEESSCTVDADVVGIALADQALNTGSVRVTLRVGQATPVCMFGHQSCSLVEQRWEFRSDSPGVATVTTDATAAPPVCNQLASTHTYPCCPIRSGTLTPVGPGTAQVRGVLLRGSSLEKEAGLMWCPPFGPGTEGCRPIAAIDVVP